MSGLAVATPGWDRFRSENYSGEEKQQRLDCHLSVLPSSYWTDTTASRQEFHYRNLWEMSILLKMFFIFSIKSNLNQSWWWALPCCQIWTSCSQVWGHWLQPSWPRQCRLTTAVVGGEWSQAVLLVVLVALLSSGVEHLPGLQPHPAVQSSPAHQCFPDRGKHTQPLQTRLVQSKYCNELPRNW